MSPIAVEKSRHHYQSGHGNVAKYSGNSARRIASPEGLPPLKGLGELRDPYPGLIAPGFNGEPRFALVSYGGRHSRRRTHPCLESRETWGTRLDDPAKSSGDDRIILPGGAARIRKSH